MSIGDAVLLEAVEEVARHTAEVAHRFFRSCLAIETKSDGSPVTVADRTAEQAARDWISARFCDDGILGEELGSLRPEGRRRWILDPIDGTKSFVHGVPLWGTLVAVCEDERILAGAACFPAVAETIAAAPGLGCWWNGSRARVSEVSDIAEATVLTTDERFRERPDRADGWRRLSERALTSRTWGDCYGYLLLVTGRAEVMVDPVMNPWDAAALLPAVVEAGGVFTDWSGNATAFGGSAVATNAGLARVARELLLGRTLFDGGRDG